MTEVAATVPKTARREREGSWIVDVLLAAPLVAAAAAFVYWALRAIAPFERVHAIDLSVRALPAYMLLSFVRVMLSYFLSLIYTVIYGTIAARNARAEKVMIPVLDVLQGIPVLGFLPGIVLSMVALFPGRNLGLELACILMVFTAMPWNMAYSYYSSLRTMPEELEQVARVHRLTWWQRFLRLELPLSATGLVWNSMMSIAGGWFFLMIEEAFTLKGEEYVLPGIGAYIHAAYEAGNWWSVGWALATMSVVVVVTDQILWKPVVTWSQRFKLEEDATTVPYSWLDRLVARSRLAHWLSRRRSAHAPFDPALASRPLPPAPDHSVAEEQRRRFVAIAGNAAWAVVALGAGYGGWRLLELVLQVDGARWGEILLALLLTSLRLFAAVSVGAALMVPIGVMIGLSPRIARRAQPIVQVIASFPAPMFFPIITIAIVRTLGETNFEWACIVLTLFATQWYILFNVIAGASAIPQELQECVKAYRTTGLARWKTLLLPGIVPYLVTGLFTAAGGAWNGAIVAEYQPVKGGAKITAHGLGRMIAEATDKGDYPTLAASILVLIVTIVLLNRFLWAPIHKKADERYALN
ncbi:MAG: ABC transporter permease [Planctomycetota bacterium]